MSLVEKKARNLAPYILQIAIGIHATFEGMSIGLEQDVASCLGIALAVICHKWAEGLTLGTAFADAKVDKSEARNMIILQAIMNPIGIGLGWIISGTSFLLTGTFTSISAGTFLYIATVEVIVEEFAIPKYKW